jgi:hypothetical protein
MGTGCEPIGSLQANNREGTGCGVKKKKPFIGLTEGRHILVTGRSTVPRVDVRLHAVLCQHYVLDDIPSGKEHPEPSG